MTALKETVVTTIELAGLLDVSAETVRKAVREGRLEPIGRGSFALGPALAAYCGHLRAVASGYGGEDEAADLAKERALLAREQREGQALKNAQARGELVRADAVVAEWENILSLIRANLLTVPIVAQQKLPHLSKHDAHVLADVVRDLLERSADGDAGGGDLDVEEEGA